MYAGSREGTLSTSGTAAPANGGSLLVKGDARVDEIDLDGEPIDTIDFAPSAGGNGGSINIYGNLTIDEQIYSII